MDTRDRRKIFLGLAVLLLVMMACGPTVTATPKAAAVDTPAVAETPVVEKTPEANNNKQPTSTGDLTSDQISNLAHATVRIWGVQDQGPKVKPIYHGSGTIISPDGLILTNCHVADPIAMGYPNDFKPDALIIDMINTEDKPPVSTYLAEVVAKDPTLDLATIQIVSKLDGSKVNPAKLNLPYVPVGDSDKVKFGAKVFVFGYPGIGGDTITFVTGDVSGFDAQDPVGNRAWIKTDATIAGGNSGGLAADVRGEIIGVPSQVGSGGNETITDCRRIQDTNGDGQIDQNDTCIPTGGFINAIRPINWAKPLIEAAQSGQEYVSPYPSPVVDTGPTPNPNPSNGVDFKLVGWADKTDNNNCPVNVVTSYPSGTMEIAVVYSFSGMNDGDPFEWHWFLNGKDVSSKTDTWQAGSALDCFSFSLTNGSDPLPDGDYVLQLFTGSGPDKVAQSEVTIGGKTGPVNSGGGVTLVGQVTDADSGNTLSGIFVVALKPGFNPDTWINNPQDSQIYTYAQTDDNGVFQLPDELTRGQKYGMVVGNKNLGYPSTTGYLTVKQDAADTVKITLKISK
jgi:serine protease Do